MAEPKPASGGPRSNPLYGGPAAGGSSGGGRTPAWARRSGQPMPRGGGGSGTFSDVASTPPESPARDPMDLPYTYYTVETPPHSDATGASPYYAPPYYVQTPAMSEPGMGFSNFSSLTSSPARYELERGGLNYASDSDTQSLRDEAVARKQTRPSRLSQPTVSRIDEEGEEFPDPERDQQRWVKTVTVTIWTIIMFVVLIVGTAGLVAWSIFKPEPPHYHMEFMQVERLELDSASYDKDGLSTAAVYGNITLKLNIRNPNSNFVIQHHTSSLQLAYGRLPLLTGVMEGFDQATSSRVNYTAPLTALNRPLYGAGHSFGIEWESTAVNLTLLGTLRARIDVVWKILGSDYSKDVFCILTLNSTTLNFTANTCALAIP